MTMLNEAFSPAYFSIKAAFRESVLEGGRNMPGLNE